MVILGRGRPRGEIVRNSVGTASDGSAAALAVPDTDGLPADGDLAAEGAGVLGVLGDFHLLHLLTQGGTVTRDIPSVYLSCPNPSSVFIFRLSFDDHRRRRCICYWLRV